MFKKGSHVSIWVDILTRSTSFPLDVNCANDSQNPGNLFLYVNTKTIFAIIHGKNNFMSSAFAITTNIFCIEVCT